LNGGLRFANPPFLLGTIARESKINAMRMKKYGVNPEIQAPEKLDEEHGGK
jgi:hypothetical protein